MHLGIGLTLAIPDFSLVMLISYLLFFEPSWIERLTNRFQNPAPDVAPAPNESALGDRWLDRAAWVNSSLVVIVFMAGILRWNRNSLAVRGKYSAYPMPGWVRAFVEYPWLQGGA